MRLELISAVGVSQCLSFGFAGTMRIDHAGDGNVHKSVRREQSEDDHDHDPEADCSRIK